VTLHARLVTAVTVLSIVLLGGALSIVWFAVTHAREEQLDIDLRAAAFEEAHEVAIRGGRELTIGTRDDGADDDDPPIAKYGVLYGTDGAAVAWTANLHDRVPVLASIRHGKGTCFNLRIGAEDVRGVLVDLPRRVGSTLLIGASREDLARELRYLGRALAIAFAVVVAFTALLAAQIVRKFTRGYEAIAEVTRRVANGDLSARVEMVAGSAELTRQQTDMNLMISQLESLFSAQQRFVAHAAHELRSPMTRLFAELKWSLRRVRAAEDYRYTIEQALDATERLKVLADDLLALARLDANADVPWQDASLGDVIGRAVNGISEELAAKDVTTDVQVPDVTVRTRRTELERLFRNLLENAIRHSLAGGRVAVTASVAEGVVSVLVTDAGPGIAPEDRPRVFEPFWRGPIQQASDAPGAGLGLAIARQIARAHGGDVELADAPNQGATFRVTLPLAMQAAHGSSTYHRTAQRAVSSPP
jgi:two-component system heavy metal sensor histidine kinase CusS